MSQQPTIPQGVALLPAASAIASERVIPQIRRSTSQAFEHTVQFFDREEFLIDSLVAFVGAGLRGGEAVVVIATAARRRALDLRLDQPAMPIESLKATGRLVALDSTETLELLLVNGEPDRRTFENLVGERVLRCSTRWGKVRVFGDMVSLLWSQGQGAAAVHLEVLWNEFGRRFPFSLLCAYPIAAFREVASEAEFARICAEHTRVIPAEGVPAVAALPDDARRAIASLQQKAAALETELAHRKRLEESLRRSRDELSVFVESACYGMHWVSAEGIIVWANQAEMDLLGYSRDEYIGRPIADFHEDRDRVQEMMQRLLRGERLRGQEARLRCKDGTVKTVLIDSSAFWHEGQFVHSQCFTRDVTEIRRNEASSRHLAAIVESSDDAIVSKDLDSIITSWNRGAERIFGYLEAEAVGRSITMLIPTERLDEEQQILSRIRAGLRVDHFETRRQAKDGRAIDVSLTISPIKDKQGRIVGASKIARDISDKKRAEREIEQARDQALAASRAKDEFLATLSHELRTPLNPVLLVATEAAANPDLPPEVRADFELIAKNVGLEAKLIDDLLDLTRITRGKVVLDTQVVDLRQILRDAIATIASDVQQKRIVLQTDLGEQPRLVKVDPVRMLQVFWNILKNAVKFTPDEGRVSLIVETVEDQGVLRVTVADSGIGLTTQEMSRLFTAFAQGEHADRSGSHRYGGLGLGLAIARTLVELHGGRIHAASPGRDQGATFTVELPLVPATLKPDAGAPSVAAQGGVEEGGASPSHAPSTATEPGVRCRILLVEDHESTRNALVQLLTRRSCDVVAAASVTEARALVSGVDFVISDIGLPDGNGFDLMRELRDTYGLKGLALTGYGMEEDIMISRRSGFVGHLTKPINVRALDEALAAHVRLPRAR